MADTTAYYYGELTDEGTIKNPSKGYGNTGPIMSDASARGKPLTIEKPKKKKRSGGGSSNIPIVSQPEQPAALIEKRDTTQPQVTAQSKTLNPQTKRFISGLKNVAESVPNKAIAVLAPATSKNSVLRNIQGYEKDYYKYNSEVETYNSRVKEFEARYGNKELSESEFNKASMEKVSLENKQQMLESKQYKLSKQQKEIYDKSTKYGLDAISFARTDIYEKKDLRESFGLDFIAKGIYDITLIPKNVLSPSDKTKKVTRKEMIEAQIQSIPSNLVIAGAGKGVSSTNKFLTTPNKIELLAAPKTNIVSFTKLETGTIPSGQVTKAQVSLVAISEPKIVKITSRLDRASQKLENARAKILQVEPKIYGEIIKGTPKVSGSKSFDIYYLNGDKINEANFLSKNYRGGTRFDKLEGGMSQEIKASILDKVNKDIRELAESLAEKKYGSPNIKAFGRERNINLGYQESKQIAKLTSKRKVTQNFDNLLVSQNRPLVKPTPSGKSISRTNIAGIIDEIKSTDVISIYKETFVGKDVTFPYKRTKPYQIEGVIVEKKIGVPQDKGYSFIKPSGKKSNLKLSSMYTAQVLRDLQSLKGGIASGLVKNIKQPKGVSLISSTKQQQVPRSIYYGSGTYERTEQTAFTKNIPEFKIEVTPRNIDRQFINLGYSYNFEQPSLTKVQTKNYGGLKLTPVQVPSEITKLSPKEITKQSNRQVPRLLFKNPVKEITKQSHFKITPRYNMPKKTFGYFTFDKKIKNNTGLGMEEGYTIFTRRGKRETSLPGIFGKSEALKKLSTALLSSLAARGGIKKAGVLVDKVKDSDYKVNTKIFRPYKIKNRKPIALTNEYIQRRNKRLLTALEKAEIKRSRRAK